MSSARSADPANPAGAINALVFDAYGTLFNVHSVVARCDELFPGKGQALSALWRSRQLEYSWLRSLMGRYVNFDQVTADALKYACDALQLSCSEAQRVALAQGYRTLQPFDDARDALSALAAMSSAPRLAILSNGAPDMLNALVAHNRMERAIPDVMSVDSVGVFKPDPRVYQLAVDRLKLPAAQIGFVSSNGWDAAGARAFGFKVLWINRGGAPVEELGVRPDRELKSLRELPGLLAGM
ncbi:MAG: haloacid dehalogenase type II [Betaproteobacteria bacterium]